MRKVVFLLWGISLVMMTSGVYASEDDAEHMDMSEQHEDNAPNAAAADEKTEVNQNQQEPADQAAENKKAETMPVTKKEEVKPAQQEREKSNQARPAPAEKPQEQAASPAVEKHEESAPVKEKVHPAYYSPEEAQIETVDIDTIDLAEPKGNWLLKRQWWEAAERSYEQIKKILDQIFDLRLTFYNERTDLDRSVFNNFFHSVGIGQGELQEIIETLTQDLDNDKKTHGSLTKKEEDVLASVQEEKVRLKKLYDVIDHINELEKALNAALITMRQQIESARENERKAWDNFKAIARELSDHKAYELYYAMNSFMTNVSEILKYLKGPFADYYHQLGVKAKKDVDEVLETIKILKEKGIDLRQQAEEQLHKQTCTRPEEEKEEDHEEESVGFVGTVWHYIKYPFVFIGSLFSGAYDGVRSLFVAAPLDEEEPTEEEVVAAKAALAQEEEHEEKSISAKE